MEKIRIYFPRNFQELLSSQISDLQKYVINTVNMEEVISFDNDHQGWSGRSHVRTIRNSFIGRYLRSGDPKYLDNAIFCYNLIKETKVRRHAEVAERVAALQCSLSESGYPFGGGYIFTAHAVGIVGPRVAIDAKHRAAILLHRGQRHLPCVDIAVRPGAPFHATLTELANAIAVKMRT